MRPIPGTADDWKGLWVRQVHVRPQSLEINRYGPWHRIAGIPEYYSDRFLLAHGSDRPAILWGGVDAFCRLEIAGTGRTGGPPSGVDPVCTRCVPVPKVIERVHVTEGLSDEDVSRIAREVVRLAREP